MGWALATRLERIELGCPVGPGTFVSAAAADLISSADALKNIGSKQTPLHYNSNNNL